MRQITRFQFHTRCYIEYKIGKLTRHHYFDLHKLSRKQVKVLIRAMTATAHWYSVCRNDAYGQEYDAMITDFELGAKKLTDTQVARWVYFEWKGTAQQ